MGELNGVWIISHRRFLLKHNVHLIIFPQEILHLQCLKHTHTNTHTKSWSFLSAIQLLYIAVLKSCGTHSVIFKSALLFSRLISLASVKQVIVYYLNNHSRLPEVLAVSHQSLLSPDQLFTAYTLAFLNVFLEIFQGYPIAPRIKSKIFSIDSR